MDPEKLFFLDKKVIRRDRVISMIFSWVIAGLLVLMERDVIQTLEFSYPVFWGGLAIFIILGILQISWAYTKNKVLIYNLVYAISGAFISVFIVGFLTPFVYIAWLMLIINSTLYFKISYWYGICAIFLASSFAWTIREYETLTQGEIVTVATSTLFVVLVNIFISSIWALLNHSVKKLNDSEANEKLVSERLSSLINSMADGVLAVDERCRVVEYNGALLNTLDLNLNLRGKDVNSIGKFIDSNNQPVDLKRYVKETKSQRTCRDFRIVYQDKSKANLYISIASVHLGFGHEYTKGFVLVMRDITREKSLEEERDEFISVVSHELRTPIAVAEGNISNAQYIANDLKHNKKIKESLDQAHNQIMFLSGLINDLATLSRAERGKLNIEIEAIDSKKLVVELINSYKPQAEEKSLTLSVAKNSSGGTFYSSRLYLKEILQNFITNSIKYTEKGGVTVSVKPTDNGVVFTVEDTGIGISKSDKERVFDKFFRSEDFRTRANSGTGLGLYVTMKLARLLHAEIDFESQLNKGSTFRIKIPNLASKKK